WIPSQQVRGWSPEEPMKRHGLGFRTAILGVTAALFSVWSHAPGQSTKEQGKAGGSQPAFLVLPYLQLPTTTGMTVMWETNQALPSRVEFGLSRELGRAAVDQKAVVLHEVRLAGLEAGTTYHYRVCSGDLASA